MIVHGRPPTRPPQREPAGSRSRRDDRRADRRRPLAQARPARARPSSRGWRPSPSSTHLDAVGPSRTSARAWRGCAGSTLVTPSRIVQANSSRCSVGTSSAALGRSASISAAASAVAGPGELAGQGQLAVALDGARTSASASRREPFEVGELGPGPVRVDVEQPLRQLGLDGDHGERVAEDVVQVAGEAGPLVLNGQLGVLLVRPDQVDVARIIGRMPNTASDGGARRRTPSPSRAVPARHRLAEQDDREPAISQRRTRPRRRTGTASSAATAHVDRGGRPDLADGDDHHARRARPATPSQAATADRGGGRDISGARSRRSRSQIEQVDRARRRPSATRPTTPATRVAVRATPARNGSTRKNSQMAANRRPAGDRRRAARRCTTAHG